MGWRVLPVVPNGKLPATAHGVKDATTDEEVITRWFATRDDLNIGIATGAESGIVVFDIDPRNGGTQSWEAFVDELGAVPDGAMQLTAGGGVHHVAAFVEGVRSCKLRNGVDLLADGRYFVAHPSTIDGRPYAWELSSDPLEGVAPFVVPERWLPAVVAPKRAAPSVVGASLITGNRNNGLAALAGAMRRHGMSSDEILAALTVANETRCEIPLPSSEVRQIAGSVARYEPEHDTALNGAMADELAEALLANLEQSTERPWLVPADEFAQQPAPIAWLVRGWWQADALIMVHGPSGGGKTFVVLDWALRMAAGVPEWNGYKVTPGPVVYLAGEGHHGLRSRVAAWKQRHGVSRLNMWLSRAGCDLNTREGFERVCEAVEALPEKPSAIIVDTLHRFLRGDENSAQDAKTMLDACAYLMARYGCSVVLVHHTGVSDEAQHRARGSSAWRGALDIEISVVPGKDGEPIQIVQRKSKDSDTATPVLVRLAQVAIDGWLDDDGEPVTSAVIEVTDEELPAPRKRASPVDKARRTWEAAWWHSGAEMRDGLPYLSRSAAVDYLVSNGMKDTSARQTIKPTGGKFVQQLLDGGVIGAHEHGWCMVEGDHANALRVALVTR